MFSGAGNSGEMIRFSLDVGQQDPGIRTGSHEHRHSLGIKETFAETILGPVESWL